MMRRLILYVILLAHTQSVLAGGNFVSGFVTEFSGRDGSYRFVFTATEKTPSSPLIEGCPSLTVLVEYERVPWYSWLPFVESSHPTLEQTKVAGTALSEASSAMKRIAFGYMGNGLEPTKVKCTFSSKGLRKMDGAVLSFNGVV